VEALVHFLDDRSRGAVVERCQLASISALKTFDPPVEALAGATVARWERRGKYLCMATASAAGTDARTDDRSAPWLVLHLARGGWVHWWDVPPRGTPRLGGRGPLAMRVVLDGGRGFDITEMGTEKRLAIWVVRDPVEVEGLATLGPEPLDPSFDRETLGRLLAGEKGTIKNALARQSLVAGIGNAYSDEILHAARLSPF
jgi:formamidopyrimidine-DNA glycosylase